MVKQLILQTVLIFATQILFATDYYVKQGGNDASTGLSDSQAWGSIEKVNAFNFPGGTHTIFFKRGNTFYGGIIVQRSNLNFNAYGKGAKPVITGFSAVTGWVKIGNNLWEARVNNVKADVNLVVRNSIVQQVGRYPNADAANGGYLAFNASSATTITGPAVSTATNWTGAEVAIRANRWNIVKTRVLAHAGGMLTFASMSPVPRVDYGYFFQRDARTLDKDGEWWYDSNSKKLRVFSSANPAGYKYQVATVDTLLGNNVYYNNITVQNITFTGAGKKAIWMYSGANHTISNVDVRFSGAEGITCTSSFNVDVNNCTTTNCLASGIRLYNNKPDPVKLSVTSCKVDSTALIAGMEISNVVANGSNGICVRGNKTTILNNIIKNSGYCGIEWGKADDVNIKYNLIERFCVVRDDGAGIYTYEASGSTLPVRRNRNITGNIILYGIGANTGAKNEGDEGGTSARGIYFDEGSRYITCDSNTVAYCTGTAIHANNAANLTITNNVFYANKGGFSFQRLRDGAPVRNLIIKNNIIYPYLFEYRNLAINLPAQVTFTADLAAMGTIDSNFYRRKANDNSLYSVTTHNDLSNYKKSVQNFSFLRSFQEKHSSEIPTDKVFFAYNSSKNSKQFTLLPGTWKDRKGIAYKGNVSIPAFKSVLLYKFL